MTAEEGLLSGEEAAHFLGVSLPYLLRLLDSGRLTSEERDGRPLVARTALRAFLRAEQEAGHAALDRMATLARERDLS